VILRRARPEDGAVVTALYAPYVRDTAITFETDPPDGATMTRRIADVLGQHLPWIVAEKTDGGIAGYAYAGPFHARHAYRFTVEPTIYLARDAIGRGLGKRLYHLLLQILAELGCRQAVALIALPNPASVALHRRCGFRQTGTHDAVGWKFDTWVDVGLFQRPLGDRDARLPGKERQTLSESGSWEAPAVSQASARKGHRSGCRLPVMPCGKSHRKPSSPAIVLLTQQMWRSRDNQRTTRFTLPRLRGRNYIRAVSPDQGCVRPSCRAMRRPCSAGRSMPTAATACATGTSTDMPVDNMAESAATTTRAAME
jgi:L-amino acid N-acyltransferase YncA